MKRLIIGHKGFVGSNLCRQFPGSYVAGRDDIAQLAGEQFDQIICAAPQAKKWWANQNPIADKQEIDQLYEDCRRIRCANHFVLCSTIDVYDPPLAKTESDSPTLSSHPYGSNRFYLETQIAKTFGEKTLILRLPALVGNGLKKNIIYDLLNNNNVNRIIASSSFQWFNLSHLSQVIDRSLELGHGPIVNIATQPLKTEAIVRRWFPDLLNSINWELSGASYDIHTIYGKDGTLYTCSLNEVVDNHIDPFLQQVKPTP